MSNGPDRRERKKAQTTQRIVECAAELFTADGYDNTTIEAIAECADVARATVFNHFARKEDLVLAWFDRRREDLAEQLAELAAINVDTTQTTAVMLQRTLRTVARFFTDDTDTGRAMVRVWLQAGGPMRHAQSSQSHIFSQALHIGHERGEFAADIDPDQAAAVLFHAYLGVLHGWVNATDGGFSLEDNLLDALTVVMRSIEVPTAS